MTLTPPPWMTPNADALDLSLFRAVPPYIANLECLRVGDIDGDGATEVVVGGDGALIWFRASTGEYGVVARGHFGVSLTLEDIDGDGVPEVVAGREDPERKGTWTIVAFKHEPGGWREWLLVPTADGEAHDVAFADLDGDGVNELVANAPYCDLPGTLAYKRADDPTVPWTRHELVMGISAEGIEVADLDGDGRVEIVHGPDWYAAPAGGPFSGLWEVTQYAPSFRDMGRVAVFDVTGDGTPDIVCSEAEYLDGRLSWFENRLRSEGRFVEHPLDWGLFYAHSLSVWRDATDGGVRVFAGEMPEGGWRAPRHWQARLLEYTQGEDGTWSRRLLARGTGTHEAVVADIDDDGQLEIVGKDWREPSIQMWRQVVGPTLASRFEHRLIDRDRSAPSHGVVAFDVDGDGSLDLVCGASWYRNPTWSRTELDNVDEVLGSVRLAELGSALVARSQDTLVAISPATGIREAIVSLAEAPIAIATIDGAESTPAIVAVATDPTVPARLFARTADAGWEEVDVPALLPTGGLVAADLAGEGRVGILSGSGWLENNGDGSFEFRSLELDIDLEPLSVAVGDVDRDGAPEIVMGFAGPDVEIGNDKYRPLGRLYVFRQSGDDAGSWSSTLIDTLRRPTALAVADVDGDGQTEIVCGEHDPSWPYRTQSRLYVYAPADESGVTWRRNTLDDRFESDHAPCVFEPAQGEIAIATHGSSDVRFVHLFHRRG